VQKCQAENRSAAEEKQAMEKRRQAMAESRMHRQNVQQSLPDEEADGVLDNLLEKLRKGDSIVRRKNRKLDTSVPPPLIDTTTFADTAVRAKDMLAQLQANGFETSLPASPTSTVPRRRARKRTVGMVSEAGDSRPDLMSPSNTVSDLPAETESDTTFTS